MALPGWLRHAFAADDGPLNPTPEQAALVERFAQEVVRRGLVTPALAFLEMSQPLNYVTSQMLTFFGPILSTFSDSRAPAQFAELLEHRGSVDYLCRTIERIAEEVRTKSSKS